MNSPTTQQSDTPRTDAATFRRYEINGSPLVVYADLARQLERERNAITTALLSLIPPQHQREAKLIVDQLSQ